MSAREKEPKYDRPMTEAEMTDAFNNYFFDYSYNDGIKFLLQYLKNDEETYQIIKDYDHNSVSLTACWIARIISLGNQVPKSATDFLNEKINEIKNSKRTKRYYSPIKEEKKKEIAIDKFMEMAVNAYMQKMKGI